VTLFSPRFFMADDKPAQQEQERENRLYPEDQAKVDAFVKRGVNSVERKPFRPLRLFFILVGVVLTLSVLSQLLARWAGVY
jgi:hypothetical protein